MRANSLIFVKRIVLALIILGVLIVGVWLGFFWIGLLHNVIRRDLTFEKAQSLVTFPICTPTYIPLEIASTPEIIYEEDAASVPEETYIRLAYKRLADQEKVFEVYQRHTNDEGMRAEYPESAHGGSLVTLLYWMVSPKKLSETEINEAVARTQMETKVFQKEQTVWWLYEIVTPVEYQTTMTKWIKDHVEYRILAYLSAEEIEKVTLSMLECSNP